MDFLEKIKPIEKFILIDQVIAKIATLIENGDLKPGDILPGERILSERLGISRTSLRQALKALNVLGVLDIVPGRKTYIKKSFTDILVNPFRFIKAVHAIKIEEIFEARRILEEGIVEIAAKKAKGHDISELKKYIEMAENDLENKSEFMYAEFMFHQYIFEISDNKILTAVMHSVNDLLIVLEKYEKDYLTIDDRKKSFVQHVDIYNAIKDNNIQDARLAMHKHLDTMESRLSKLENS
ncbi:MAG: FadR family transcriptional regulator [Actinobacteria bacterium]|nr:FadR family transcriptional regulator [Actinomycetota bacterium]